jgi:hypothetical protein
MLALSGPPCGSRVRSAHWLCPSARLLDIAPHWEAPHEAMHTVLTGPSWWEPHPDLLGPPEEIGWPQKVTAATTRVHETVRQSGLTIA